MQVHPLTPMVKRLMIINGLVWLGLVLVLQNFFLQDPKVFSFLGLVPSKVFGEFHLWQPFTYMFVHAGNLFHILFNLLMLWFLGAELEHRWGSKFFLTYYLWCGFGAAWIYLAGIYAYTFFTGHTVPLQIPVIGASGAVFGLILAYGIVFGERIIYFMMMFPMKAKVFVLLLGAIEIITLLDSGFGSRVANLAHLGGIVAGFFVFAGGSEVEKLSHGAQKVVALQEAWTKLQGSGKPTQSGRGSPLALK